MIDRDQLTEARRRLRHGIASDDDRYRILDAVDFLLDFPTDEMVEAAWLEMKMGNGLDAALEAVRRVMYGETE